MNVFCRSNLIAVSLLFALLFSQPTFIFSQRVADRDRLAKKARGEALFKEAATLADQDTPEKRREAIKKFLEAAEIFGSIGSRREQALSLLFAGEESEEIGERRRAIEFFEQ